MKCVCGGCMPCYIGVYQCGLWSIVQVYLCGDWSFVLTWLWEGCRAKNTSIKLPRCIKLAFHFIPLHCVYVFVVTLPSSAL